MAILGGLVGKALAGWQSVLPKTYSNTPILSALGIKPVQAQAPSTPLISPVPAQKQFTVTPQMASQQAAFQSYVNTPTTTNNNIPTSSYDTPSNTNQGSSTPSYEDIMRQQQDAFNQQLEADYNSSMTQLSNQETGLRGQAETATGQITNEAATTGTTLGAEQATKEQGVQTSLSTGEKQGTSAMQQARDLYRQTQQQNVAQLSALGISSSSVTEALAERLGVETARRIAGVTGSVQEMRQNATNELGRIKNYYAEKATQIQDWVANEKSNIQNTLLSGLNQINAARQTAASDKAAKRATLMSQVQTSIANLAQQQQQFEQSLKLWAEQKSTALQPISAGDFQTLFNKQMTSLQSQFNPTQFNVTPTQNVNQYGQLSGSISVKPKTTDEEDLYKKYGITSSTTQ